MIPVSSPCKTLEGFGALSVIPGGFTDNALEVVVHSAPTSLNSGGTYTPYQLCDFNPGGAGGATGTGTCSGSASVTINAGDEIAVCMQAVYATPPHSAMAWTITCTNP